MDNKQSLPIYILVIITLAWPNVFQGVSCVGIINSIKMYGVLYASALWSPWSPWSPNARV